MVPKKRRCHVSQKKRFPTRVHARFRADDLERKNSEPLYTYRCWHCGDWHLTHYPQFDELILLNLHKP